MGSARQRSPSSMNSVTNIALGPSRLAPRNCSGHSRQACLQMEGLRCCCLCRPRPQLFRRTALPSGALPCPTPPDPAPPSPSSHLHDVAVAQPLEHGDLTHEDIRAPPVLALVQHLDRHRLHTVVQPLVHLRSRESGGGGQRAVVSAAAKDQPSLSYSLHFVLGAMCMEVFAAARIGAHTVPHAPLPSCHQLPSGRRQISTSSG